MKVLEFVPNMIRRPAYDDDQNVNLRKGLTLLLGPALIFYLVAELVWVGAETMETGSPPVNLLYTAGHEAPKGGALGQLYSRLWDTSLPAQLKGEDISSWGGENGPNKMLEIPLEIVLHGTAMVNAGVVKQSFDPYSRCTAPIARSKGVEVGAAGSNSETHHGAVIETSLVDGSTTLFWRDHSNDGEGQATVWGDTRYERSVTDQGCIDCESGEDGGCSECQVKLIVKLCGRNMPGAESSREPSKGTHISITVPTSAPPINSKIRAFVRPMTGDDPFLTIDDGASGDQLDPSKMVVRPAERVAVSMELNLNLDNDYKPTFGGYIANPRGSILMATDEDMHSGSSDPISELRLTLGAITYSRRTQRWAEIPALVGGMAGVGISIFASIATVVEKQQKKKKKKSHGGEAKVNTALEQTV